VRPAATEIVMEQHPQQSCAATVLTGLHCICGFSLYHTVNQCAWVIKKTKVNPAKGNNFHLLHHPNKTHNCTVLVKVEFLNAGHGGTKSNNWASEC
jgi:hypothetical protein